MSKEYFDILFKALVSAVLGAAVFVSIVLTITGNESLELCAIQCTKNHVLIL